MPTAPPSSTETVTSSQKAMRFDKLHLFLANAHGLFPVTFSPEKITSRRVCSVIFPGTDQLVVPWFLLLPVFEHGCDVVLCQWWGTSPDCHNLSRLMAVALQRHWLFPMAPHGCILFGPVVLSIATLPQCSLTDLLLLHRLPNSVPRQKDQKEQSADKSKGGRLLSPRLPHDSAASLHTQNGCTCAKWPGSIWAHNLVHPCGVGHPLAGFCQLAVADYSLNHRAP